MRKIERSKQHERAKSLDLDLEIVLLYTSQIKKQKLSKWLKDRTYCRNKKRAYSCNLIFLMQTAASKASVKTD